MQEGWSVSELQTENLIFLRAVHLIAIAALIACLIRLCL